MFPELLDGNEGLRLEKTMKEHLRSYFPTETGAERLQRLDIIRRHSNNQTAKASRDKS